MFGLWVGWRGRFSRMGEESKAYVMRKLEEVGRVLTSQQALEAHKAEIKAIAAVLCLSLRALVPWRLGRGGAIGWDCGG